MQPLHLDPALDRHLPRGRMLQCYEVLRNDHLCAWIDTVKPRLYTLFTYGRYGPLQSLLYNSDSSQLRAGHWGIYPYAESEGERVWPFQCHYREGDDIHEFTHEPREIQAAHEEGFVALRGVPAFLRGEEAHGDFDWGVRLLDDAVLLHSRAPASRGGFALWLYPLYDWADLDGRAWPLCYRVGGWAEAETVTLTDSRQRMPRLRLHAPGGRLRVRSSQDHPRGAAYRLQVESLHEAPEMELALEVLPNPAQVGYSFPAVPEPQAALLSMAGAVSAAVERMAQTWPAVAGAIPASYRLDTLAPYAREENEAVCQYMARVAMLMSAASLATRDSRHVEVMFRALETYRSFCRPLPDGRLVYPPAIAPDGRNPRGGPRPSDYAIAARGYLYCAEAYAALGEAAREREALARARELGVALALLQGPDGSFSSHYAREDPRWHGPGVAVNNVSWVLWQLQERLAKADDPAAEAVRRCAREYVAFELDRRRGPSALRVPGPGTAESVPMYHDDFATVACHFLTRHADTGETEWLDLARQASACAVFASGIFHLDQPEAFAFMFGHNELPMWLGGVRDTFLKGGMQDKSGNEVLLALARAGDARSGAILHWRWYSRLAWSLEASGGLCGLDVNVPGYRYRNTEWTEELNYGGVGFAAWWLLDESDCST